MTYTYIQIPNMFDSPYTAGKTEINNIQYSIEYKWNIRADKPFISIYTISEDQKEYLVRDYLLSVSSGSILRFCHNSSWSGNLFLQNKNDIFNTAEPNIKNISTDYHLVHVG